MTEIDIFVEEDGTIRYVHDDDVALALKDVGAATTVRASHVEPYGDGWAADMRPSGGPVLGWYSEIGPGNRVAWNPEYVIGFTPFTTRRAALKAERDWLRREKGL